MKSPVRLLTLVFTMIMACSASQSTFAQSAPASSPSTQPLSDQDKMRLLKVRQQVLDSNPALKTEGDDLKKQGQALKGGDATPEDKMAFMQSMQAHQEKMKAAMLKIDPTLGPIIDQAQAEMKQRLQQRAGQ